MLKDVENRRLDLPGGDKEGEFQVWLIRKKDPSSASPEFEQNQTEKGALPVITTHPST